jgi:mono/diheme cytochrome c family protein
VGDIRAYLSALEPAHAEGKRPELPWPLSVRAGMAVWNALFFREGAWQPEPGKSAQWNRGGYLVEGLGHCGACHTDKNFAGAPKKGEHLEGGYGENWYATSLTGAARDGLGDWTVEEIAEYLKTGSNAKAAATGPMAEVVENSTQHLSDADLAAIAAYLKDGKGVPKARPAKADAAVSGRGEGLYVDQCSGCHMRGGEGQPNVFPPLKGNSVVQAKDPETVIHMVLDGARVAKTAPKPTGLAMPAFGGKLSDRDVAELATFLRNAWGNEAGAVSASQVSKVRGALAKAKGG